MEQKNDVMSYEDMIKQTRKFYKILSLDIEDNLELAVTSLTMPQYAKIYNDKNEKKISHNGALATVGDSICAAHLMLQEYNKLLTKDDLTKKKVRLTNKHLNKIGKELLEDHLFAMNNDLKKGNKKDYATAFEAVIGFIAMIDLYAAKDILDKYLIG